MNKVPILFIIFNRPDTTEIVFKQIQKYRPSQLYIAADGPRPSKKDEDKTCKKTREYVLSHINWDCEVKTLFRSENLGCGFAVSEAITWFFSHVEMGIILEDDCVPNSSFFEFCTTMLHLHKETKEIMHISGTWYLPEQKEDFIISKHPFVWGWATWRRSWEKYNLKLHGDSLFKMQRVIFSNLKSSLQTNFWINNFKKLIREGWNFTWDYQWFYSIWKNNGITITPTKNLISNIGFNKDATHTTEEEHYLANVPTKEFKNTKYNSLSYIDFQLEKQIFNYYFAPKKQTVYKRRNIKFKIIHKIRNTLYAIIPELNDISKKSIISDSYIAQKSKCYLPNRINNSIINDYSYIAGNSIINNTLIGKFCSIGPNLICGWGIHPTNGVSTSPMFYSTQKQNGVSISQLNKIEETKPIIIGNDVFIGMNVTILDGITIGDGAIIGAGSVVSKDIPPYAIAVGNPITIKKYRFDEKKISQLLKIKWWEFNDEDLKSVEKFFFDVDEFIRLNSNALQ